MASNKGKWDVWYKKLKKHVPSSFLYGDTVTYSLGAEFLKDCEVLEDWGVGAGGFKRFRPDAIGVDGSNTPFADKKYIDLVEYETTCDGIYMRHVLEHNEEWEKILTNAVNSATKKICIVLFTELSKKGTKELARENNVSSGIDVPDLALDRNVFMDILKKGGAGDIKIESYDTATTYGKEFIFCITMEGKGVGIKSSKIKIYSDKD
jgi:hypothetical protein